MDETQLINGCRKGDRLAQKELYERYSRKMRGVCLRYVNDRETARDLLQDGLLFGNWLIRGVDAKDLCKLCIGIFA